MFLQETEVDFFFKFLIILALFWQKVLEIGLFFLEKRKLIFFKIFNVSKQKVWRIWPFLANFSKIFERIANFFQNIQGFTHFVAKLAFFPWRNGNGSSFFSKFLKLFRYRGEDVMKMGSENGKIENLQGFKRFVAKSLKI